MGDWSRDQSKTPRRYDWRGTRGERDAVCREVVRRKALHPELATWRAEKIGPEVHLWRQAKDPEGKLFWNSSLRLQESDIGYWTLFWRPDESRWRATGVKSVPLREALAAAAELLRAKQNEFL